MAIRAWVEPDGTRSPLGHARLILSGAPDAALAGGFRVHREGYAKNNLGPRGWQVGEALLQPVAREAAGGDPVLILGPALTRHIEPGPIFVVLPGFAELPLFWPDSIEVFEGDLPPAATLPEPDPDATVVVHRRPAPAPEPAPPPAPAVVADPPRE
ncbi:MAG: hypothetical protein K2X74_05180, partial [Acetobacteraceae bacterium]|nr:hypothetical protein [Acetobacteraceae bacterium]